MNNILKVKNIEKYYGNKGNITKAIDDISFEIHEGEFIGIMGSSGSGKTTLLNCISTIDRVTAGHIFIDNSDLTELSSKNLSEFRREKLGFVFQDYNLLDTLTGFENIAISLTILKESPEVIEEKIQKVSKKLGIEDVLNKYPYEMSGGQQQRVAAARAIIKDPTMILADEPTGSLDSKSSKVLMNTFSKLHKDFNATIILVTHDAYTASYTDRILFLKDGKIFNEIIKGEGSQKEYFTNIIEVTSFLGGDMDNVI
ncbi:MAG: ABC transporter ATP-binding protein [Bacillota bacterium]|nr:ABC transporter ATP-binding protein [Bacillota bacterium]